MKFGERMAVVESDIKFIKKLLYFLVVAILGTTGVEVVL